MVGDFFKSIFFPPFYRKLSQRSFGNTFLYLLLLAVIVTISFTIFTNIYGVTRLQDFIAWAQENFPPISVAHYEMTTTAQEPYMASYDAANLEFIFSTQQPFSFPENLQKNAVVFEKERALYVDAATGEYNEFAYDEIENLPENAAFTIDKPMWQRLHAVIGRWAVPVVFGLFLLIAILAFCFIALLYSIIGFIFSLVFRVHLPFPRVYSIAAHALTFWAVYTTIGNFVPLLQFAGKEFLLVGLTLGYVLWGVLANKERRANDAHA